MNDFRDYVGINDSAFLAHYGVGHLNGGHSGRYPWGSSNNVSGSSSYDTKKNDVKQAVARAPKSKYSYKEADNIIKSSTDKKTYKQVKLNTKDLLNAKGKYLGALVDGVLSSRLPFQVELIANIYLKKLNMAERLYKDADALYKHLVKDLKKNYTGSQEDRKKFYDALDSYDTNSWELAYKACRASNNVGGKWRNSSYNAVLKELLGDLYK